MAGTTTFIATDPNGTEHTRSSRTMTYTHALLVSDDDARTWYARSWHTSDRTANEALSANGSYAPSGIRRLVEVTEKPKGRQPKAKITPLSQVGPTGSDILDAAIAAEDTATAEVEESDSSTEVEETPQQRRNRKARERRAAKKQQADGTAVEDTPVEDDATPEPLTDRPDAELVEVKPVSFADDWDAEPVGQPDAEPTPVVEDEDAAIAAVGGIDPELTDGTTPPADDEEHDEWADVPPVGVVEHRADCGCMTCTAQRGAAAADQAEAEAEQAEAQGDDRDAEIAATLEVTPADIEAARAAVVKGDRCPGYKMAVPDEGGKRAKCPVCDHSVKRYPKSGLLGSHRA